MCIKKSKNYGLYSMDSRVLDTIQLLHERDFEEFSASNLLLDNASSSELVRRKRALKDMQIAGLLIKTRTESYQSFYKLSGAGKLFVRFEKEISSWIGTRHRASFSDFLKYLKEKKDYVSLNQFVAGTNYLEKLPCMNSSFLKPITKTKTERSHNGKRLYSHPVYALNSDGLAVVELIENCSALIEANIDRFFHEQTKEEKYESKTKVRAYPADIFRFVDYSNGNLNLLG
jgi:hypothetical protein